MNLVPQRTMMKCSPENNLAASNHISVSVRRRGLSRLSAPALDTSRAPDRKARVELELISCCRVYYPGVGSVATARLGENCVTTGASSFVLSRGIHSGGHAREGTRDRFGHRGRAGRKSMLIFSSRVQTGMKLGSGFSCGKRLAS